VDVSYQKKKTKKKGKIMEGEVAAVFVPIDKIKEWGDNPRINAHAIDEVADSIRRFGFASPIIARAENGEIIAGHTRYKAARKLGLREVPVRYVDLDPVESHLLAIADNKLGELAMWDQSALKDVINALKDEGAILEGIGFDDSELNQLLDGIDAPQGNGLTDPDEIPDSPEDPTEDPTVKRGELWQLGNHRLMCGDSTCADDVAALMGGEKADMVFTDPPYDLAGQSRQYGVRELRKESYGKLYASEWDKGFNITAIGPSLESVTGENATVYVCTSHFYLPTLIPMFDHLFDYSNVCVWSKPNPMPSLSKRHWTWGHEFIMYGTKGKHTFNFPEEGNALSVWKLAKSVKNDLHPTQKPVHVPAHAINHSSKPGDLVADLFMGSGSTLIACEQMDRKCNGMELSPAYCDVIIKRWEDFTGNAAILESDPNG